MRPSLNFDSDSELVPDLPGSFTSALDGSGPDPHFYVKTH